MDDDDTKNHDERGIAAAEARVVKLEAALLAAHNVFAGYAKMHSMKLMDGSISDQELVAIRGKVDRNLAHAFAARQALKEVEDVE